MDPKVGSDRGEISKCLQPWKAWLCFKPWAVLRGGVMRSCVVMILLIREQEDEWGRNGLGRGVKLIFTGGHVSLAVAFQGLGAILGLYKC